MRAIVVYATFTVGCGIVGMSVGQATCPAGQLRSNNACISCGLGYHVPVGATGDCSQYQCPSGSTDHDSRADTPCITCGVGHYVPAGSSGSCFLLQCPLGTTDRDSNSSTPCQSCVAGQFAGRASSGQCQPCPAGTTDADGNPTTQCETCAAGSYAPPGSRIPCSSLLCPAGTLDIDQNASTPCTRCGAGTFVPEGEAGDSCLSYACRGGSYDNDNSSATRCVVDFQCGAQTVQLPYFADTTTASPVTSAPTAPSQTPTLAPTAVPTNATTLAPTATPTANPTSVAPTAVPTAVPSSLAPTRAPTNRSDFCFRNCRAHYPAAQTITDNGDQRYTYVTVIVGIIVAFVLGSVFGVAMTMYCVRPASAARPPPPPEVKTNPLLEQQLNETINAGNEVGQSRSATPDVAMYMSAQQPEGAYYPNDYASESYLNVGVGMGFPLGFQQAISADPASHDAVVY